MSAPCASVYPFLFTIVLCLGPCAFADNNGTQVALDSWTITHFEQARQAETKSQYQKAADEYKLILSRKPAFAEAWLNLGIVYQRQSQYKEAARVFRKALSIKPQMIQAQVLLGISLYSSQDYGAALVLLEEALAQDPKERQAGLYRALALSTLDQPEAAAQQLRKTLMYYPADPEILYQLGEAYSEGIRRSGDVLYRTSHDSALYEWAMALSAESKHDNQAAIRRYLEALRLDPLIPEIYPRLATLLRQTGLTELSHDVEQRFLELNPPWPFVDQIRYAPEISDAADRLTTEDQRTYAALWAEVPQPGTRKLSLVVADSAVNQMLNERLALVENVQLRTALNKFQQGDLLGAISELRNKPPSSAGWLASYLLSRFYFLQGDAAAAESALETMAKPALAMPSVAILKLEVQSELVVRTYDSLIQSHPEFYGARMIKARTLGAAGKFDEAIHEYWEVLQSKPSLPQVHLAMAQLYAEQSKWESAADELTQELAISPDNGLALALLGRSYVQIGKEARAIPVLRRVISRYPTDALALGDLGKALAGQGQTQEAIEKLLAAVNLDPSQYRLHYRLFELYRLTGQNEIANKHLAIFKAEDARRRTRVPNLQ